MKKGYSINLPYTSNQNSVDLEKKFNDIKFEITRLVLNPNNFSIPPQSSFEKLDLEFSKIKEIYLERGDMVNLLHTESNYFLIKSYQFLEKDPSESLYLFLLAVQRLLDRNQYRAYSQEPFTRMLRTYKTALIKISGKAEQISCLKSEQLFREFISRLDSFKDFQGVMDIGSILSTIIIDNYYAPKAKYVNIHSQHTCQEQDGYFEYLNNILNILNKYPSQKVAMTKLYNLRYSCKKNQLFFYLKQIFFEQEPQKKLELQEKINAIINQIVENAELSFKTCHAYFIAMPDDKRNDPKIKAVLTQYEIDKLTAYYYREAYFNKDILKAWKVMDQIKHLFVTKAFKENMEFSQEQLSYYSEEWTLLYIFAKICLLKDEVSNRMSSLNREWQKTAFTNIIISLDYAKDFFKYELTEKKDYSLKIMTSTFAGNFSEYLIHQLLQEYHVSNINKKSSEDFNELFACIKSATCKEAIVLNYILENGKPDVDIYVKDQCGIFLKNAVIDSGKIKKIWGELTLCKAYGIYKIFYGFNFAKNIEQIEYIRKQFEKISSTLELSIEPFDIKDLVSVIFDDFTLNKHSSANFHELDLFRVLDY